MEKNIRRYWKKTWISGKYMPHSWMGILNAITEIREVPILIYKCNKILNQNPKSSWNLISWSKNSYVTAKGKNSQEITEEEQEYPDIKTYV